ncbi:MAG: hypothetical protein JO041_01125 [Acidobacteria bacterium]|nr:hypothetical protein [Acidobacteriota bacterium]
MTAARSFIFLLAALVLALPARSRQQAAAPAQAPAEDENSRRARKIIDQAIQALGGEAYLNIQDYEYEARSFGFSHGKSGIGAPVWGFWKWPDKDRAEFTKQRDVIRIYNAESGWEVTYKGTAPLPPPALADFKLRREYSLPHILRLWLQSPGVALFYAGTAVAEQKPAEHVTIYNGPESADLFLDLDTHLPIKKAFTHRDPEFHDKDVEEDVWGNYRMVQGVNTPFDVVSRHNGEIIAQRFISRITYNKGLPDSLFTPRNPVPMLPPTKQ